MSYREQVSQWEQTVSSYLPHLSRPQAKVLVLCISVLYRECALPVAWAIVPAWGKGAWKPIWLDLFDLLAESVPSDWTVIVLADRGLYARWLYQHLQRLGWHPFLRINQGGKA